MPPYYTYQDPYPTTPRDPNDIPRENPANWPKAYDYVTSQGLHPPGPVYQLNGGVPGGLPYGGYGGYGGFPGLGDSGGYGQNFFNNQGYGTYPYQNTQPNPYYYGNNFSSHYPQTGWPYTSSSYPYPYPYSSYYPSQYPSSWFRTYYPGMSSMNYLPTFASTTVPGQPMVIPQPMCPASMTAQAAAAAAANKALAQMPNGPAYWVGGGQTDFQAQQAIIAAQMGYPTGQGAPTSLAPYKPSDGQQFWCKELDGSWTLRTYNDLALGEASPGHWERHATSGYFFWVRQAG